MATHVRRCAWTMQTQDQSDCLLNGLTFYPRSSIVPDPPDNISSPQPVEPPTASSMMKGPRIVVLVTGPAGSGKSTLINSIVGSDIMPVGDGLELCTRDVKESDVVDISGHQVIFVDTPGFDNNTMADKDVLKKIYGYLDGKLAEGAIAGGLIYLHDITLDVSPKNTALAPMKKVFEPGDEVYSKLMLAVGKWDVLPDQYKTEAERRWDLLQTVQWAELARSGATMLAIKDRSQARKAIEGKIDIFACDCDAELQPKIRQLKSQERGSWSTSRRRDKVMLRLHSMLSKMLSS
ncbi:TKL/TKL-ccin protein kinase [Coprinopsis cinerea AmutBmut pab1-1]|nr:TKL/TKL-ccin protein kinase [Coprinopsis cinerea AmutBmut pab1-1]